MKNQGALLRDLAGRINTILESGDVRVGIKHTHVPHTQHNSSFIVYYGGAVARTPERGELRYPRTPDQVFKFLRRNTNGKFLETEYSDDGYVYATFVRQVSI